MKNAPAIVTAVLFVVGALASSEAAPPEINFQLRTLKEANVEGPDVDRTYFTAGAKRIVLGVPNGSQLRLEDGHLLLTSKEAGFDGEIQIKHSPFAADFDLTTNALAYREAGTKMLPRGAGDIQVQPPVLNVYPFNGWKSIGFTWGYSIYGRRMVRTTTFLNLELGTQVMITTDAIDKDAERIAKLAKQFMSSWWVMEP